MTIDKKPVVGQLVYRRRIGNPSTEHIVKPLEQVVVTKVGRLYFYAKPRDASARQVVRYRIKGWHEANPDGYPSGYRMYETRRQYADEIERVLLLRRVRDYFADARCSIELKRLRAVSALVPFDA